jgi:hypothetical protein
MGEDFSQEHLKVAKIICTGKVEEFKTTSLSKITMVKYVISMTNDEG